MSQSHHQVGRKTKRASGGPFEKLLEMADSLSFQKHDITRQLDAEGHYDEQLHGEFPFLIRLFDFSSRHHTRGLTWHERLELFLPLDGPARLQMGDQVVDLEAGDLLVVDNLKLHRVMDFAEFDTRVIVISFLPEFVYSLGSPSHDYAFLLPFYCKIANRPHVLKGRESENVFRAMTDLLNCYFARKKNQFYQAGCKAFFLQILFQLACHFESSDLLKWEFLRQQQRSLRLKKLFDHISLHFAEKISVSGAARLVGMSDAQFMKLFKQVAGMTLVAYLHHVRLSNAARLLKDTNDSIADIASKVGFTDQSYFDKRFKKSFGQSPNSFRSRSEMDV